MLLRSCLSPALEGARPLHCWLYGPSGSGKTCVAKHELSQMNAKHSLGWLYVNCWDVYSFSSVIEKIVRDLKILRAEVRSTSYRMERLRAVLRDRPFLFLIDEVDRLAAKERSDLIYNLSELGNVGLVCIGYKRRSLDELDTRVKSRLNPIVIEFKPYPEEALRTILEHRAEFGLLPDTWKPESLSQISQMAAGDARIAIQTLRNAAYHAEKGRKDMITEEHLKQAWIGVKDLKKLYALNSLTPQHRLVYRLIDDNPGIASGELWQRYLDACKAKKLEPVAIRTFREYVKKLIRLELILAEKEKQWGSTRTFRTARSLQ